MNNTTEKAVKIAYFNFNFIDPNNHLWFYRDKQQYKYSN